MVVLSHKMASCGLVVECSFTYPFLGDVGFHFQICNFHQQLSNYVKYLIFLYSSTMNQKLWWLHVDEHFHDGWKVEKKTCTMNEKLRFKVTPWIKYKGKNLKNGWKCKDDGWKNEMTLSFFFATSKNSKDLKFP